MLKPSDLASNMQAELHRNVKSSNPNPEKENEERRRRASRVQLLTFRLIFFNLYVGDPPVMATYM